MTTLKDFLELDACICGLTIDVRQNGHLQEIHIFGVGAWQGNGRDYIEKNIYREFSYPREVFIYLHPDPINFKQTKQDVFGVIKSQFPSNLLKMNIRNMKPFTASFLHREMNGTYYSINLELDDPETYKTPVPKSKENKENTENISFDELLEAT